MAQYIDQPLLLQVAARVKSLREARGYSQEQVYFDTGIHVGRIKTARLNVTVSTLGVLCRYFEIDTATFFKMDEG